MNNYTLKFYDKRLEEKYFDDQFTILFKFYTWACYMGSFSALAVFIMEFISPFGFGWFKYLVLIVPFAFLISNKLVQKFPYLFNWVMISMNVSIGVMINILLIFSLTSDILFLAG